MSTSPEAITRAARDLGVDASALALFVLLCAKLPGAPCFDELVRVDRAGVEIAGLRAKIRRGEIPVARIGRADYVRRSDLLALAAPRTSAATSRARDQGLTLEEMASLEREPRRRRKVVAA